MAGKTETVTLQEGGSYELVPAGTGRGEYHIVRNRAVRDPGNISPYMRTVHEALTREDEVTGQKVPIVIDANTTLVVNGSDKATLNIPSGINRDEDGFRPRIEFHTAAQVENGPFIVARESTAAPRIPLVKGDGITSADDNKGQGSLQLTTAGSRTYTIEQGAPKGITFLREGESITIATKEDFGKHQRRLEPPKVIAPQEKSKKQEPPQENRDEIRKRSAHVLADIRKLGKQNPNFRDILNPLQKTAGSFTHTDHPQEREPFVNALDTAIEKLEKRGNKRNKAKAEELLEKLKTIRKEVGEIEKLHGPGEKTSMFQSPAGLSSEVAMAAVQAAKGSTGTGDFVIGSTAKLSPIPNLGGRGPNQIS